ncbi:tetraspanin family domain-containing protein [Phthorimaea operculella]|nr:tetraspanin family domain-containing protein [Phthorimaea operculella]
MGHGDLDSLLASIACVKTFVIGFNLCLWLLGLFLLGVGLWMLLDLYKYWELSPEFSGTAPHVLIGIALLLIVTTSIAFSCIIRGQSVLLFLHGALLMVVFFLDLGVGVTLATYGHTFREGLHNGLTNTLMSYDPEKVNFDFAQSALHCCGVSNYTDWVRLSPQRVIPISCCVDPQRCVIANYNDVYQRGCYETILEYLNSNSDMLIGMALATCLLPFFGSFATCVLANITTKGRYDAMME